MNTKISYLYRDADNYKMHNKCVIAGTLTTEQARTIKDSCEMGEYFIPRQVGLPERRFDRYDPAVDHCWFELDEDCFSETVEPPTVNGFAGSFLSLGSYILLTVLWLAILIVLGSKIVCKRSSFQWQRIILPICSRGNPLRGDSLEGRLLPKAETADCRLDSGEPFIQRGQSAAHLVLLGHLLRFCAGKRHGAELHRFLKSAFESLHLWLVVCDDECALLSIRAGYAGRNPGAAGGCGLYDEKLRPHFRRR